MASVAGASRYLNSATIANRQGTAPSNPSLLSSASGLGDSLLSAGRRIYGNNGIGLSSNARAYNQQFLSQTRTGFNAVFGMSTAAMSSVEIITQKINAIRASLPQSMIAESLRGKTIDEIV
jgi:hypothetical protein